MIEDIEIDILYSSLYTVGNVPRDITGDLYVCQKAPQFLPLQLCILSHEYMYGYKVIHMVIWRVGNDNMCTYEMIW